VTLALIAGIAWFNWRQGQPSIWSHPWMGFTLAGPAILLLMLVISPGKLLQGLLDGSSYPLSMSLVVLLCAYVSVALWVMVRVVYRMVGCDWLLVAMSGFPITLLTAGVLVAQWLDPSWQAPLAPGLCPGRCGLECSFL
jgi:hypothetical protein